MDPINPIAGNPTAVDNIPETPQIPQSPQPPKDNHGIMIASMAIFVILALSAVAFLYYQNQQLKGMLASYQTPISYPTPTATTDPTANWETYINGENGYSIKFAKSDFTRLGCIGEELTAVKYGTDNRPSPMTMIACERDSRYDLETKTYTTIQKEPEETKYYNIVKKDVQLGGVLGKLYVYTFTNIEDGPYPEWYAIAKVNKNNKTYEIYFSDKNKLDLFDQILSTFKFLEVPTANPTTTPKATITPY